VTPCEAACLRAASIEPGWKSEPMNSEFGKALAIITVDQPCPQPTSATLGAAVELLDGAIEGRKPRPALFRHALPSTYQSDTHHSSTVEPATYVPCSCCWDIPRSRHDSGGDVILKREDGDRRLAEGEGGRRDDWRKQAFKTLACFGQFSGDAWVTGMDLGPTWCATRRMIRSPSAGASHSPVSASPSASRSIQILPSGLSMTLMTPGSSSHAAIAGPNAVRNMRAPRETASDRRVDAPMTAPARHRREMQPMNGDD
jgi:hypothetical protein